MHPAPNLLEAPPKTSPEETTRAGSVPAQQQQQHSPIHHHQQQLSQSHSPSPPRRQSNDEMTEAQHRLSQPPQTPQPAQPMSPPTAQQPLPPVPAPSQTPQQQHETIAQPQQSPFQQQHENATPGTPVPASHHHQSASPPLRKDTDSSVSTLATAASAASAMTADSNNTSYSADTSPSLTSMFHVKDGADVSNRVRASRRRTGPLSQQQREKAALIRKLGACVDCRRRRVACNPSHHNMSWEDAVKKYHRSHSPNMQDIAPSMAAQTQLSPTQGFGTVKSLISHDPNEMDIDSPSGQPGQARLSDARLRTPLPAGPRMDKSAMMSGLEPVKTDLQANASQILSNPYRSRYTAVQVLLLHWQDEPDPRVASSVAKLAEVLDQFYRYTFEVHTIPSTSENVKSPWRWLSRKITDFSEERDQRDVLKIVYYNGHAYLDANGQMVLASSRDKEKAETLRWDGIHQSLEEATGDTLIIMDAPYFASSKMSRQNGVLELIAAAVSEEHYNALERCAFTRTIIEQLRERASQRVMNPFSAAELHAKLTSLYPSLVQRNPDDPATSFPSPLHMQMTGNARLPSILLTPTNISPQRTSLPFGPEGQQLHLSIRVGEEPIDVDAWTEWLRNMPEGVKDLRVEGPFRAAR